MNKYILYTSRDGENNIFKYKTSKQLDKICSKILKDYELLDYSDEAVIRDPNDQLCVEGTDSAIKFKKSKNKYKMLSRLIDDGDYGYIEKINESKY